MTQPRTIEQALEEQGRRWEFGRRQWRERPEERSRLVVTISRQHGAGGSEVARRVASSRGLDLFDREIIHRIAESAQQSEGHVESLDDRDREPLAEWVLGLGSPGHLSPIGYRAHLESVVRSIARRGGAVVVGRGAHMILGPAAMRVLVVAPLEVRVATIMRRVSVAEAEARRTIAEVESARSAFLRRHFHADFGDPAQFDLVVNTGVLGIDGAVSTIEGALASIDARRPSIRAGATRD